MKSAAVSKKEQQDVGGVDKVVDILGRMEKGSDRKIVDSIEMADPELAEVHPQRKCLPSVIWLISITGQCR